MTAYTFDQLITFTRTSAATYVGSNGLVAVTPASRNLLLYTQEFDNAAWSKTNATALPFDPALISLGSELVTNGTFDSGTTGWITGAGWSITGGQLVGTTVTGSAATTQTVNTGAGRWFAVTFTVVSVSAGQVSIGMGASLGTARSSPGTYTEYFIGTGATNGVSVYQRISDFTGTIDNISVREVIGGLITAPDGTLTADAFVASAGVNLTPRITNPSPTTTTNAVYTVSCFARPGTHPFIQLHINAQIADWCNFTLIGSGSVQNNGAAVGSVTYDSVSGWYRISMTYTAASTAQNPFIMLAASASASRAQTWSPAGTESIYLWGAQLELGSAVTSYARNFGGLFPPRFDYDPVTKAPRGLLVEEQRTNLLVRSEEFDNASWTKDAVTVTANTTVSPNGAADADIVVASAATQKHIAVRNAFSPVVSAGSPGTFSFYAKAAGYNFVTASVLYGTDSGGAGVVFDLVGLTAVLLSKSPSATLNLASITDVGNGWRRCVMTVTNTSQLDYVAVGPSPTGTPAVDGGSRTASFAGDGTSGIYLWGAQLEAGAFATSYIPTVASQVTRTADQAVITAPMFAPWYRQSEGTFVAKFDCSGSSSVLSADDTTNNNFIRVGRINTTGRFRVFNGGVDQADVLPNNAPGWAGVVKIAAAYKANDFAASASGGAASTDTSGTIPAVTQFRLGTAGSGDPINGHIQSIDYYPTRLTNAQIQALTA